MLSFAVNTVAGLFLDVTSNYTLDDGQKDEYADYSRIVRKDGATIPSRRVRVIFDKFTPINLNGPLSSTLSNRDLAA